MASFYEMHGTYFFNGKDNVQSGNFIIDERGIISGEILDLNSAFPKREVAGKVEGGALNFVKKSDGTPYCDIFYVLKKIDDKDGLGGTYEGFWSVKKDEAHPSERETENKSSLTLRLRSK